MSSNTQDEDPPVEPYKSTNPHRDLPSDQAVHDTIKQVLYINDMLIQLHPIPLPRDDCDMHSLLLRSLEVRHDLTWLVLQETGVKLTVGSLGGMLVPAKRYVGCMSDSMLDLAGRAKALNKYWSDLVLDPETPYRWEPEFETTLIPPFIKDASSTDSTPPLTSQQSAQGDALYASYRHQRDHVVSYLKRHPPKPMGLVPLKRPAVRSTEAWDSLLRSEQIQAGDFVRKPDFDDNIRYAPIYSTWTIAHRPLLWKNPDAPESLRTTVERQYEEATRRIKKDRRERQAALLAEYKAQYEAQRLAQRAAQQE